MAKLKNFTELTNKGRDIIGTNWQRDLNGKDLDELYEQFYNVLSQDGSEQALFEIISTCFYTGVYEGAKIRAK